MYKDDALVVQETREIVQLLPEQSQSDVELVKAIAGSLREGQDRHTVQIKALELAYQRLDRKVDKGFELIAKDLQSIKHEAQIDRVHASYAKEAAQKAAAIAEQAWAKTQEVAIGVAKAEAKADGARDLAKTTNKIAGFDPLAGMAICSLAILFALWTVSIRTEKKDEPKGSVIKCGEDVQCTYNGKPANFKGGV